MKNHEWPPALTQQQRTDLLAAAMYISARDDDTCTMSDANAERTIATLMNIAGYTIMDGNVIATNGVAMLPLPDPTPYVPMDLPEAYRAMAAVAMRDYTRDTITALVQASAPSEPSAPPEVYEVTGVKYLAGEVILQRLGGDGEVPQSLEAGHTVTIKAAEQ